MRKLFNSDVNNYMAEVLNKYMKYYAMIDIGASSGRILLAEIDNQQMALQEVHRFKNGFSRIDGSDRWDIEYHF